MHTFPVMGGGDGAQVDAAQRSFTEMIFAANGTEIRQQTGSVTASHTQQQQQQQQQDTSSSLSSLSEASQTQRPRKRKRASRACAECRRSHSCCDSYRPCSRCVRLGLHCFDQSTGKTRGGARRRKRDQQTAKEKKQHQEEDQKKQHQEGGTTPAQQANLASDPLPLSLLQTTYGMGQPQLFVSAGAQAAAGMGARSPPDSLDSFIGQFFSSSMPALSPLFLPSTQLDQQPQQQWPPLAQRPQSDTTATLAGGGGNHVSSPPYVNELETLLLSMQHMEEEEEARREMAASTLPPTSPEFPVSKVLRSLPPPVQNDPEHQQQAADGTTHLNWTPQQQQQQQQERQQNPLPAQPPQPPPPPPAQPPQPPPESSESQSGRTPPGGADQVAELKKMLFNTMSGTFMRLIRNAKRAAQEARERGEDGLRVFAEAVVAEVDKASSSFSANLLKFGGMDVKEKDLVAYIESIKGMMSGLRSAATARLAALDEAEKNRGSPSPSSPSSSASSPSSSSDSASSSASSSTSQSHQQADWRDEELRRLQMENNALRSKNRMLEKQVTMQAKLASLTMLNGDALDTETGLLFLGQWGRLVAWNGVVRSRLGFQLHDLGSRVNFFKDLVHDNSWNMFLETLFRSAADSTTAHKQRSLGIIPVELVGSDGRGVRACMQMIPYHDKADPTPLLCAAVVTFDDEDDNPPQRRCPFAIEESSESSFT